MIPDVISKLHLYVSQDVKITHRTGAPNCLFQKISVQMAKIAWDIQI